MSEKKKVDASLVVGVIFAVVAGLVALAAIGFVVSISVDTKANVEKALAAFPDSDDGIDAMLSFVRDDSRSLPDRNSMVWALGRKRDPRILPALLPLYTGEPCDHDAYLCQYELSKTINLNGGKVSFKYADRRWNR